MQNNVTELKMQLNGKSQSIKCHSMSRLLDVLREEIKVTGTKEGCGEGECGACAVLVDGKLANACLIPAGQVENKSVVTVEGLSSLKLGKVLQDSFLQMGGAQCGICTPGMLVASYELLSKNRNPSEEDMREALAGNLCRCTGYTKIFDAIRLAAKVTREERI